MVCAVALVVMNHLKLVVLKAHILKWINKSLHIHTIEYFQPFIPFYDTQSIPFHSAFCLYCFFTGLYMSSIIRRNKWVYNYTQKNWEMILHILNTSILIVEKNNEIRTMHYQHNITSKRNCSYLHFTWFILIQFLFLLLYLLLN